jgi:hypothetical protein
MSKHERRYGGDFVEVENDVEFADVAEIFVKDFHEEVDDLSQ